MQICKTLWYRLTIGDTQENVTKILESKSVNPWTHKVVSALKCCVLWDWW